MERVLRSARRQRRRLLSPQPAYPSLNRSTAQRWIHPLRSKCAASAKACPKATLSWMRWTPQATCLASQPTTIVASDAGTGGSGPWAVDLNVAVAPGTAGSIRAYSPSPADGSLLADVSVSVIYGVAPPPVEAAISIDIPLSGEIISSEEVVVVGQGMALPENNVVVQALDASGVILAEQATTVAADLGGAGEWRATLQYSVAPGAIGQIFAFSASPADGSIIAQSTVSVQYGMAVAAQPAIVIQEPQPGAVVDPGQIVVNGTGTALPENSLAVRIVDADGTTLAEQAVTVSAELGGAGPWSATFTVVAAAETSGRIEAFSTSPADGSIVAQTSVDIVFGRPRD